GIRLLDRTLGARSGWLRSPVGAFQGMASAGDGVTLTVHEALDLKSHFHFAAAVETLAGTTLIGLQLRELRLPETKNVGLDAAQARNIANLEVQAIGNDGRVGHALSSSL